MYKPTRLGNTKGIAVISTMAAILIAIYANYVYGASQTKEPDKKFRSEEELIDETRQAIEKHLKDTEEVKVKKSVKTKGVTQEKAPEKEIALVASRPRNDGVSDLKKQGQSQSISDKEDGTVPVFSEPEPVSRPGLDKSIAHNSPGLETGAETGISGPEPAGSGLENGDSEGAAQFEEEKGDLPSDVTPVAVGDIKKPIAAEVDFSAKGKGIYVKPALEEPILKKMDIGRIGASPYYETYEGLRLLKYFTVAQRVEIYQEPRPIDSYIMDAQAMRYLYGIPWNIDSDYRTQITPIFTRAYGTEFTISDPKNKEGQIRYTLDYRDIYKNYFPKYNYDNKAFLEKEMWDQNEILLMHSKQIDPLGWLYTSNIGYRYSTMSAKSDINYYEIRNTYFGSLSLAPTDKIEYFFQGEYYKSQHVKSSFSYSPDHFLGRTEVRIKSNDYKTMYVPQFSYSKDLYYPFSNSFEKYEIALRVGRDFTKRFSASSTLQFVYSFRDEPDNKAPTYAAKNPIKDKADCISLQNRFSYNVYDRLYLQAGLDIANGLNWSVFDNIGFLGGIEYYAPGMIRVDVGWRGNYYYDLADFMSSIYFKFYLFM